jgi:hypothetical protein
MYGGNLCSESRYLDSKCMSSDALNFDGQMLNGKQIQYVGHSSLTETTILVS